MYLDEMHVGMEIEIPEVTIDRERMMDFARLYDPIPLHLDEEYAKSTRFGGLIAPGVMSFMAVWAEFVKLDIFGDSLVAGRSTKIEWFKPVYAGDILRGVARISDIRRRNDYNGVCEITIDVFNRQGERVLSDVTDSIIKYSGEAGK
ncbi:MAG: MaoC family dehydratase N-terminal domain-containing protein [Clostridia bacterium]|nr:MaoC family dehydratase N-terminal domain-containing protein [Clostridia bacterium]